MTEKNAMADAVDEDVESSRLWLDILQSITARAAHDVRGALNGVAVNLEVVRSRSAKAQTPVTGVHRFAATASAELEGVVARVEGLLFLARPPRQGEEIGMVLKALTALLSPPTHGEPLLRLEGEDGGATRVEPLAVRALLGGALLAATERLEAVTCTVEQNDAVRVRIAGGNVPLRPELQAVATMAGVSVQQSADALTFAFPVA